ncbi:MAG TPA: endonuclease/exonuclease/phosphatase family protein [Usitatibacter sp.]|jgi:endonuclease/exonuclease/phosphatase family metal-dependent hydrolase|nr:endonuclease/exonuclease/phosphatase family protein [Usitatibacter sp.]
MATLRLCSYNIHCGIGRDRRFSEKRILDVLREVDADVIALQEVESRASGVDMLELLAKELGFHAIFGSTLLRPDGHYGNGLLARCPIRESALCDLSWRGREPRGAISADIDCDGHRLRIVATHLGLRPAERREQVTRLINLFRQRPDDRAVLLGDLNEWFLWGRPLRRLHRYFEHTPSPATFPARMPFLALDRIWTHPRSMLKNLRAHRSRVAAVASDHLPIVATLEI